MQDWSANNYLKFEDERTRPARDLANAIPIKNPMTIIDIGCGPGNSTEVLYKKWPKAKLSGFDSSKDMIEKAKIRLPNISFSQEDIYNWLPPKDIDIVFSNAVFQWLPDHIEIMQNIVSHMKKGSVLAIQMPDNLKEPTHQAMREVAQNPLWQERIGNAARKKLADIGIFYDAFSSLAQHVDIWHSIYNHIMPNHAAIIEWVSSTGLRPFLAPLSNSEKQHYLSLYLDKIKKHYTKQSNGDILLSFPRFFMVIVK